MQQAFVEAQRATALHIKHEEEAFSRFHEDLNRVVRRLDNVADAITVDHTSLKEEIVTTADVIYLSKDEYYKDKLLVSQQVAADIATQRNQLIKTMGWVGTTALSLLTFLAWLYVESKKTGVIH